MRALEEGLRHAIDRVLDNTDQLDEQDRLFFTLSSNRLNNSFQGWGLRVDEWRQGGARVDAVFTQMANALNSNEQFEMDDSFQVSITQVRHAPVGSGHRRNLKPGHQAMKKLTAKKTSIIRICNNDELCCARALVTAKARIDNDPDWGNIRKGRQIQTHLAKSLHQEAGVDQGPCGYEELHTFAEFLQGYQLLVVDGDRGFRVTSFSQPNEKKLIILHADHHYDVVTSLPGFFGTSYFCHKCLNGYNDQGEHQCSSRTPFCRSCLQVNCMEFVEAYQRKQTASVPCRDCGRKFFGPKCYQTHKELNQIRKPAESPELTICATRRKCPDCLKLEIGTEKIQRHRCGFIVCPSCQLYVDVNTHKCFIQKAPTKEEQQEEKKRRREARKRKREEQGRPAKRRAEGEEGEGEEEPPPLHVFFDIEAIQPQGRHIPNLVVAEVENDSDPYHFTGDACVVEFLEWLEELTEEDTRQVNVIAHNFQGYDGYFVVEGYHSTSQMVEQLRNGCKLLEVKHDRVRFIDSLSFFAMLLSAFPKTFGLTELKKGYFPRLFNLPEHQDYVGPVPSMDYYIPESMSPKGRKAFETWHADQRKNNVEFHFAEELVQYCESDVRLLKEGCMTFKTLFEEQTGFNPFEHVTIASACNRDLRINRMIPNSIASEPVNGWRNQINQSVVAKEWLHYCDHQLRQQSLEALSDQDLADHDMMARAYPNHVHPLHRHYVQHVDNAGEYRIPRTPFTVGGYHEDTHTEHEFHGCFWHGCRSCYPVRNEPHLRLNDRTMDDVYANTQRKINLLKARGYRVIEMWECQWQELKSTSPEIATFVASLKLIQPLNPRDAFCGGRTNAVRTYHHVDHDEEIHYIDYTSLYPFINKTSVYPKGHPTFITQPGHTDISQYFGFVKC